MRNVLIVVILCLMVSFPNHVIATPINWDISVGDTYSWFVSSLDSDDESLDESDFLVPIWWEFEPEETEDGGHVDTYVPRGIYLDEVLNITIKELPNSTISGTEIQVNGDYAKGILVTPRTTETLWLSPYLTTFQFVIPTNPNISSQFPNHQFNSQGVLNQATADIRVDDTIYTVEITRVGFADRNTVTGVLSVNFAIFVPIFFATAVCVKKRNHF